MTTVKWDHRGCCVSLVEVVIPADSFMLGKRSLHVSSKYSPMNPSSCGWGLSVWTKVVDRQTKIPIYKITLTHFQLLSNCVYSTVQTMIESARVEVSLICLNTYCMNYSITYCILCPEKNNVSQNHLEKLLRYWFCEFTTQCFYHWLSMPGMKGEHFPFKPRKQSLQPSVCSC